MRKLSPKKRIKASSKVNTKLRFNNENVIKKYSALTQGEIRENMNLNQFGLTNDEFKARLEKYGTNEIEKKGFPWVTEFFKAFFSPFNIILFCIFIYNLVDYLTYGFGQDLKNLEPGEVASRETFGLVAALVVLSMVLIAGSITYIQSIKTYYSTKKISAIIKNKTNIIRHKDIYGLDKYLTVDKDNSLSLIKLGQEIEVSQLVPGDLIYLSSGDLIPADVRIIYSNDLFINQSSLTGESMPVEKHATNTNKTNNILELDNICYTGTSVVSGSAIALVIATANDTYFATISKSISAKREEDGFMKGIRKVTHVIFVFMAVLTPIVFLLSAFALGDKEGKWLEALFTAVAVAVGLTPEMMPLVITTNLSNGAVKMSKQKVVAKHLNAIQALGAIDILATDKTGTLTNDKIKMEEYKTVDKKESPKLLEYLFINSYFQTGLKNPMDNAVLDSVKEINRNFDPIDNIKKIDEIPFDFNRRKLTIVADIPEDGRVMITKGSMEEILKISNQVFYDGKVQKITNEIRNQINAYYEKMNAQGKRVLGVGIKPITNDQTRFTVEDEKDLIFYGYATFLDTPKPSAKKMVKILNQYGVQLKILTGDNEQVTRAICEMVDLKIEGLVTGDIIESASEYDLKEIVEKNNIFVKLNPLQKVKILQVLKENKHTVGFMGDGINDAPVLRQSDVAISVANATDIAKDASDIILLEKSLEVLEKGIVQGRIIFGNILKYLKLTTASNIGNVVSLIIAIPWVPFAPMLAVQMLFQNLMYDLSQLTISSDRVDERFIKSPQTWRAKEIVPFALFNGPISSIFDILMFVIMGYAFGMIPAFNNANAIYEAAKAAGDANLKEMATSAKDVIESSFQGSWFMVGVMTQSLVVLALRSEKWPFFQTNATWPVNVSTAAVCGTALVIGMTPAVGGLIKLSPPLDWTSKLSAIDGIQNYNGTNYLNQIYSGPQFSSGIYVPILAGILVSYLLLAQFAKMAYMKIFKTWI